MQASKALPKNFVVLLISRDKADRAKRLLNASSALADTFDFQITASFSDGVTMVASIQKDEGGGHIYIEAFDKENTKLYYSKTTDHLEGMFICPDTGHILAIVASGHLKGDEEEIKDVDHEYPLYADAARYFILGEKPNGPGENELVDMWNDDDQLFIEVSRLMMDHEFSHLEYMETIEAELKEKVAELLGEEAGLDL